MSKVWLILSSNSDIVSVETKKVLAYDYESSQTSPADFMSPIGIVFDHGDGGNIHAADSPARYVAADPIITGVQVSNLEGRLLTLADASFSDLEQRKAFKDVLRDTLWRWNGDNERRVRECFDTLNK